MNVNKLQLEQRVLKLVGLWVIRSLYLLGITTLFLLFLRGERYDTYFIPCFLILSSVVALSRIHRKKRKVVTFLGISTLIPGLVFFAALGIGKATLLSGAGFLAGELGITFADYYLRAVAPSSLGVGFGFLIVGCLLLSFRRKFQ